MYTKNNKNTNKKQFLKNVLFINTNIEQHIIDIGLQPCISVVIFDSQTVMSIVYCCTSFQ